jgi:hypothetical protein
MRGGTAARGKSQQSIVIGHWSTVIGKEKMKKTAQSIYQ